MFNSLKIKDFVQLVVIIGVAVLVVFLYVNNQARNSLWLKTYPARATISKANISCSDGSPEWMADVLRLQVDNGDAPSNQIAYIDGLGNLHHCENGYVTQYPYLSDPVTSKTRFRYASVTKLWTSDAILTLIKQGKLRFDTPLSSILTEIQNPEDIRISQITIGQLLLHRAGFDRQHVFGDDMFGIGKEICPNHIDRLNTTKLIFSPDERMSYSNLGYCLLGEVISRVEKEPYTNFINQQYQINKDDIRFISNQKMTDEVFYNHVEIGLTGVGDIYTAFNYDDVAAAAGLSGSAIGMAKQIKKMINKPVPNILTLNNGYDCNLSELRDCYGYAMYPFQHSKDSLKVFFRDGRLLGLSTLAVVTDDHRVVTLLSNGVPVDNDDKIKFKLYDILQSE